jgi:hypothetical protein
VSWKPLVKSKASAVITTTNNKKSSRVTGSDSGFPGDCTPNRSAGVHFQIPRVDTGSLRVNLDCRDATDYSLRSTDNWSRSLSRRVEARNSCGAPAPNPGLFAAGVTLSQQYLPLVAEWPDHGTTVDGVHRERSRDVRRREYRRVRRNCVRRPVAICTCGM